MGTGMRGVALGVVVGVLVAGCTVGSSDVVVPTAGVESTAPPTPAPPVTATSPPPPSGPGRTLEALEVGIRLQVPREWTVLDRAAWGGGDLRGLRAAAEALGSDERSLGFALEEVSELAYGPGPAGAAPSMTVEYGQSGAGPAVEEVVADSVAATGATPQETTTRPTKRGSAVVVAYTATDQRGPVHGRLVTVEGPHGQVRVDVTSTSAAEADRVTDDVIATVVPIR